MTRAASGAARDVTKQYDEIRYLADDLECINQLRNPDPNDPLSKFPTVETPAQLDARETESATPTRSSGYYSGPLRA